MNVNERLYFRQIGKILRLHKVEICLRNHHCFSVIWKGEPSSGRVRETSFSTCCLLPCLAILLLG